jgi:hypothetical protein
MEKEEAIRKINPHAIYVIRGADIDTCEITWLDGTNPISKSDIYHNGIDGWKATIKVTKDKYPKS